MTDPHPGNREYRDEHVRVAELTVTSDFLRNLVFRNCVIIGPAVLALLDGNTISHCQFDSPDLNALFWVVPSDRPIVMGAVGVADCTFQNCRFQQIGFAGPESLKAAFASDTNS